MKEYNTFVWSSDYETFTGEGLLARCFVENYFKSPEIIKIYSNNNKYLFLKEKYFLLEKKNYKNNFLAKYLYPFYGVLLIWYNHIKGKKTCYVNYLPLWNFLIFISLPRSTILGPVTGSIYNDKIYNLSTFFRKIVYPFFYFISLKIIFSVFTVIKQGTTYWMSFLSPRRFLIRNSYGFDLPLAKVAFKLLRASLHCSAVAT